jgi:putative IS1239, transposase
MMFKAKGVNVGISTIYCWIHHGKLGLTKQNLLYPRKGKLSRNKLVSTLNLLVNPLNSVLKLSVFA